MFHDNKSIIYCPIIIAVLFGILMVVMVCQMTQTSKADYHRNRPEANAAYETTTQREVEQLSQEVERLRLELAKSQETKAAVYRKDNDEMW